MNEQPTRRVPLRRAAGAMGLTRPRVARARMRCERRLLAARHARPSSRNRILSYHGVGTPEWGVNDVTPDRFRRHLELALEAGYEFAPARELAGTMSAGDRRLAITFDDGLRSVANAAPMLADYRIPWTMFVVAGWADGNHPKHPELFLGWRDIECLAEAGATIGSHSMTHPDFGRLAPDALECELVMSRDTIRQRIGVDVTEFAIPMGRSVNWTPTAGEAARSAGYAVVYAQSEERRPAGTVPRTFISSFDGDRLFRAALGGAFDAWEEWI